MLQADQKITLEMTAAQFNQLAALAEPAFRTVALIMELRQQVEAQDMQPAGNGAAASWDPAHVSDR